MLFGKKDKLLKCDGCKSKVQEDFDFCPYCGTSLIDKEQELKDFGMLGKRDAVEEHDVDMGLGVFDKMIGSVMKSLVKNLSKQFEEIHEEADIVNLPNGISISVGVPRKNAGKKVVYKKEPKLTDKQIEKMQKLPRAEADSNVRRLSDKVVYELKALGVERLEDIFVTKLENGYEVKAIGKKKVYVNNIPVNLPLKGYGIAKEGLIVEFLTN